MKVVRLVKDHRNYQGWLGSLVEIEGRNVWFDFEDQTIADPRSLPIFAIVDDTYRHKWLIIEGRTYELSHMTPESENPYSSVAPLRYSARLEDSSIDFSDCIQQILEETLHHENR